jgi:hypothetical protein
MSTSASQISVGKDNDRAALEAPTTTPSYWEQSSTPALPIPPATIAFFTKKINIKNDFDEVSKMEF